MKKFKILWEREKRDTETQSEKWTISDPGSAQGGVATNVQFAKMQYLWSAVKQSAIKWGAPVCHYRKNVREDNIGLWFSN